MGRSTFVQICTICKRMSHNYKLCLEKLEDRSMYRNVLFLNYAQIAINTNVSETSKLGDISVLAATLIIGCYGSYLQVSLRKYESLCVFTRFTKTRPISCCHIRKKRLNSFKSNSQFKTVYRIYFIAQYSKASVFVQTSTF